MSFLNTSDVTDFSSWNSIMLSRQIRFTINLKGIVKQNYDSVDWRNYSLILILIKISTKVNTLSYTCLNFLSPKSGTQNVWFEEDDLATKLHWVLGTCAAKSVNIKKITKPQKLVRLDRGIVIKLVIVMCCLKLYDIQNSFPYSNQ